MYFYLLLFFSKAIFWGEDWDPQKMLGTPIWSDMWVPGPRMKNPSAIPASFVATWLKDESEVLKITDIDSHFLCTRTHVLMLYIRECTSVK